MSRPVTLFNEDGTQALGNVLLPSNTPFDPMLLSWKSNIYVAGYSVTPIPGNYESYLKISALRILDDAVVAPNVVPAIEVA